MTQLPAPPATPRPAPAAPSRKITDVVSTVLIVVAFFAVSLITPHGIHRPDLLTLWAGTFLGFLLGLLLQNLTGLLLGRLGGTTPTLLMAGSGPLAGVVRLGPLSLVLRGVPLPTLQVCTAVVRVPALRARLLLGGLARVLAPGAFGLLLLGSGHSFVAQLGAGFLMIGVVSLVAAPTMPGTVAWMIFRAPFAEASLLEAVAGGPAEVAVQRALLAGRVAEARARLAGMPDETVFQIRLHAAVALAEGRYAEAVGTVRGAREGRGLSPQAPGGELLLARAGLFALEDGSMPREDAAAAARIGASLCAERIPRLLRLSDIPPTEALLAGRGPEALRLARRSLRASTDLQTRAYVLCTLAGAQAVTGDRAGARASLDAARRTAPELARIATVERLISTLG